MNMTQIRYALAVAEQRSFSRAADKLFISQPALSLQIHKLEQELNFPLFDRTPQGVFPTPEGRTFCEEAAAVLAPWEQFQRKYDAKRPAPGRLRIGVGSRAFSNHIFELIVEYFGAHPEAEVTFLTDIGDNFLSALSEGRLDLAVSRLPPAQYIQELERFSITPLLRERQCVLLSPDDPLSAQEGVRFQELQGRAFVTGPENSMDEKIMRRCCRDYGVTLSNTFRSDNIETVMSLIRSGKGIALGPPSFIDYYHVAAVPLLPETEIELDLFCLKKSEQDPGYQGLRNYLLKRV
jgi:DNA-binding transcriptional LysR family regulator